MRSPVLFGKYLLLERISVGGMAEVFKAKTFGPDGFEKIVAIKRILPSMAEDEDFIAMFIDEAKIAGQLSHANICQIFELGKIGSSHFIAMEYVQGKDVLQIQNRFRRLRKQMPLPMAALIASKVCEGLDYAHRKCDKNNQPLNIIHRDVSPQNVLVSYEGEVKIIDFGIAKAVSRSAKTQAGVLKGKFGYMSPEQVRGLPLDRRSDTFAIGTLLWEMCTDERLFAGPSDFAVLEKVRNATVPPPSSHNPMIPPELEAIIMRALKRDTLERYQWSTEMQEALQNYLMSQSPPWAGAALSSTIKELFAREMSREQAALEHYKKISEDDLAKYAGPAGKGQIAVPPVAARSADAGTFPVQARPTAPDTEDDLPSLAEEDQSEAYEQDPTQVGGPIFATQSTGGVLAEAVQVSESEQFDDGVTLIFDDAEAGKDPEPGEPTFIFNNDLGLLEHAVGRPLFEQPSGSGNGHGQATASLDHGPTVVFNYDDVVKAPSVSEHQQGRSTTTTVTAPSTLFKDILIGVLSATVLILAAALVWFAVATRTPGVRTGALVVSTNEPGLTRVLIDGQDKGTVSPGAPVTIRGIIPGKHWLVVSPEDVDPLRYAVEIGPGEVKVQPVSWHQKRHVATDGGAIDPDERPTASDAGPSGRPDQGGRPVDQTQAASSAVGAADAAVASPRREPRRPPPPRRSLATTKQRERATTRRRPPRPPRPSRSRTAAKASARVGYLVANTVPWAKVEVDGHETGRNTPIAPSARLELKPGKHRVTFVVGEERFSYTVRIKAGETTRLIKKLSVEGE